MMTGEYMYDESILLRMADQPIPCYEGVVTAVRCLSISPYSWNRIID